MTRVLLWHWGRRGGGPRYTLHLARALATDPTLDVHLSVSRQAELYPAFRMLELPRLDVDTYTGRVSAALGLGRLLAARARFARYLQDHRIDVVVCTMTHVWNVAMLDAIARAGARYVLTLHDLRLHAGECSRLRRWLLHSEARAADTIVTLSEHVREDLARASGLGRTSIGVVPLGVSERETGDARPRAFPTGRRIQLLFFGRMLPYKGLELLLQAFAQLRTQAPVDLVVAGWGPVRPDVAALAARGGVRLENRWFAEGEIDQLFREADLVVLPYREASQSGVVVHAFEHRVPVVATPVGGLVEQVSHLRTGVIAPAVSADGIAAAVLTIVRAPALYEACSREIGRVIENTSGWSRVGAAMAEAIRRTPAYS
jgi:glycosyltransferase involved in cell wall biosynthesis